MVPMIGNRVGHFEIVEKLGEGGMGVVYKARDLTLNRLVALKALSSGDTSRKQRFLQEAQAASALNHPNIVTVYEIFREEDDDFIAMELIDGKTLAESIGKKNFRLTEALKGAEQIASALAAAHGAGIVHRDLKPANVMMTSDGHVKVLDFGLAKVVKPVRPSDATETLTSPLTEQGTVMGTVAYMSPEQAEGQEVDWRSDIFSFGSLLYEMVTGRRAFERESRVLTMSAVLEKEPEPATEAPRELQRLIARCMRKKPAERAQSMVDVKHAIEEIRAELASGQMTGVMPAIGAKPSKPLWPWAIGAVAIIGVAAFALRTKPAESVVYKPTPLTSYPGSERQPALSPDGKQVAFVWNGPNEDNFDIYVRRVGAGEPLRLTTDKGSDSNPVWSRDGDWIAFNRAGSIYVIPALGGTERLIGRGGGVSAWTADNKWLLLNNTHDLMLVNVETGDSKKVPIPINGLKDRKSHFHFVSLSVTADAARIAVLTQDAIEGDQIFSAGLTQSGEITGPGKTLFGSRYLSLPTLAWAPDGKSILLAQGVGDSPRLFRLASDGSSQPELVAGIGEDIANISIAGDRLVYGVSHADTDLWKMEITGGKIGPEHRFAVSSRAESAPRFSPDGSRIAFNSDRAGARDIWIVKADGTEPRQITRNFNAGGGRPHWSPDGTSILFGAAPVTSRGVYRVRVDGGVPEQIGPPGATNPFHSLDGKSLYLFFAPVGDGYQILRTDRSGKGPAIPIPDYLMRTQIAGAGDSPDGKWIWVTEDAGIEIGNLGRTARMLARLPVTGGEPQPIAAHKGLGAIAYGKDGVYFVERGSKKLQLCRYDDLKIVDIAEFPDERLPILAGTGVSFGIFTISPDAKTIVHSKPSSTVRDLMLVDNFK